MKTLKYQGYVVSKDPKDTMTNKLDSSMSYYMPSFAEKVHKAENSGKSTFSSMLTRLGQSMPSMPTYLSVGYNYLMKAETTLGKDAVKFNNFLKSTIKGTDEGETATGGEEA